MGKKDNQEKIRLSILFEKKNQPIDLGTFNKVMQSYHKILYRSHLVVIGKSEITPASKHDFEAKINQFENGSIIVDFIVERYAMARRSLLETQFADIAEPISFVMREIFDFFKARYELRKKNMKEPKIIQSDKAVKRDNINIIVLGDKNTIQIPERIKVGADMTEGPFRDTLGAIKTGNIKSIRSKCDSNDESLFVDRQDIDVLNPTKWSNDVQEQVCAKIYKFDSKTGKGKLRIMVAKTLSPNDEFNFAVSKKDVNYSKIINAMHESVKNTPMIITRDFEHYASGETKITRLHIKSIVSSLAG